MLLNIDTDLIDYARRILMWLCFSKRPLTVPELIDGVAVELGDHARLNRKRRLYDGNDILQNLSRLQAEDDKPSYIVSVAHYSVQEYLESNRLWMQEVAFFLHAPFHLGYRDCSNMSPLFTGSDFVDCGGDV
jgi:hypothetical protein